jgi:hypothetical protein
MGQKKAFKLAASIGIRMVIKLSSGLFVDRDFVFSAFEWRNA